jgi:hypothetical protein
VSGVVVMGMSSDDGMCVEPIVTQATRSVCTFSTVRRIKGPPSNPLLVKFSCKHLPSISKLEQVKQKLMKIACLLFYVLTSTM